VPRHPNDGARNGADVDRGRARVVECGGAGEGGSACGEHVVDQDHDPPGDVRGLCDEGAVDVGATDAGLATHLRRGVAHAPQTLVGVR
jgi:hypothetical protein